MTTSTQPAVSSGPAWPVRCYGADRAGMGAVVIWLKLKGYLIAAGALLAAIAGAALYGRAKGKASEQVKTRAAQEAATAATEQVKANEVRHEVEVETARLPDAPPQKVADADPASAAGKLRDDGWVR